MCNHDHDRLTLLHHPGLIHHLRALRAAQPEASEDRGRKYQRKAANRCESHQPDLVTNLYQWVVRFSDSVAAFARFRLILLPHEFVLERAAVVAHVGTCVLVMLSIRV